MPVLFNNCRRRDHSGLFGAGAFYDLNCHGRQAKMAIGLRRGEQCVVATPDADGNVLFSWFAFSHEALMAAEDGAKVRVMFGDMVDRPETLSRKAALAIEPYSKFFDVNKNFKRQSVIDPRGYNCPNRYL